MTKAAGIALVTGFLSVLGLGACGGGSNDPGVDEYEFGCEEASGMEIFASDESYREFANKISAKKIMSDPTNTKSPLLLEPNTFAKEISAINPPTFSFRGTRIVRRDEPGWRRQPAGDRTCRHAGRPGLLARLSSSVTLVPRAYAHCPAVSGENFLLRLSAVGKPADVFYTALLSVTTFRPTIDVWQAKMKRAVGTEADLTLLRAVLSEGKIIDGPYQPMMARTFLVK